LKENLTLWKDEESAGNEIDDLWAISRCEIHFSIQVQT
jgi:hypothetical protein